VYYSCKNNAREKFGLVLFETVKKILEYRHTEKLENDVTFISIRLSTIS
jgi:hypothetical protein